MDRTQLTKTKNVKGGLSREVRADADHTYSWTGVHFHLPTAHNLAGILSTLYQTTIVPRCPGRGTHGSAPRANARGNLKQLNP